MSSGVGFCVMRKYVRCNATSRQYLNLVAKMGMMEWLLNLCLHKSLFFGVWHSLGVLGNMFGGGMCGLRRASTWVFGWGPIKGCLL